MRLGFYRQKQRSQSRTAGAHHPKFSAEKATFSMAKTRSDQTLKYNPSIKRNFHRAPSKRQFKICSYNGRSVVEMFLKGMGLGRGNFLQEVPHFPRSSTPLKNHHSPIVPLEHWMVMSWRSEFHREFFWMVFHCSTVPS